MTHFLWAPGEDRTQDPSSSSSDSLTPELLEALWRVGFKDAIIHLEIASAGAEVSNLSLVSDNSNLNFKKTEKIIEIKTHKPMNFRNGVRWISHVVNESCVERGISQQREPMSTVGLACVQTITKLWLVRADDN